MGRWRPSKGVTAFAGVLLRQGFLPEPSRGVVSPRYGPSGMNEQHVLAVPLATKAPLFWDPAWTFPVSSLGCADVYMQMELDRRDALSSGSSRVPRRRGAALKTHTTYYAPEFRDVEA